MKLRELYFSQVGVKKTILNMLKGIICKGERSGELEWRYGAARWAQ